MTRLRGQIAGCLRTTIDAHGPITHEWVGSAAKRIACQLIRGDSELSRLLADRSERDG